MDFKDKVVIVTGASGGIGRVLAQQFAEHGARVVVHFHQNEARAEETLASLQGESHLLLQADLRQPEAADQLTTAVVQKYGRVDVLVNNAGIYERHEVGIDSSAWQSVWQRTVETNLMAPAYLTHRVAQEMIRQRAGKIVNISSRGAFRGEPSAPAYAAAKAGLNAMSQSLAQALASFGVFVYVVAPGFVETDMVRPILKGPEGEEIRRQSPLGRVARADEVARTVVFLASEGTDFLTGCIVDVNGASYLRS
ncbi:MAG: SDR family NAD(P)-dependent oxidoreductase [Calditrichaeota bacterium]|nr:MAG: SDR family NAD(P)-dependent oxidoreductase [Calditrichota bacterium]